MSAERRSPAGGNSSNNMGGKGEMTKTPISLQDLRRSLYVKAKAEPTWRFWGLYVHVCKMETLREAYQGNAAGTNRSRPWVHGFRRSVRATTNTTLFPETWIGFSSSGGGCVGCGIACYRGAASAAGSPWTGLTGS